ncbi:hypothetical protein ACHAQA_003516 [Verticillium albo-atrum]
MDAPTAPTDEAFASRRSPTPASPPDEEALMRQAMGFSAFGNQDSHPSKRRRYNSRLDSAVVGAPDFDAPTGANATVVTERQSTQNDDEIDLDNDDDDDEQGAPLDPRDAPALAGAQAQIEEMLAQEGGSTTTLPNRPNPAWGLQAGRGGRGQGRRGGHQPQEDRGEPAKPWWEGYYDAWSNENPWKALEEKAGLVSSGTWVARGVKASTG